MLAASRQRHVKQRHCNEEGNRWSQRSSMDDGSTIASFISPKKSRICIENVPPSDRSTERSPASLRDEIRRALSLRALDVLHKKNSMKVCEQRQLMYDMFHGDKKQECHIIGLSVVISRRCMGSDLEQSNFLHAMSAPVSPRGVPNSQNRQPIVHSRGSVSTERVSLTNQSCLD